MSEAPFKLLEIKDAGSQVFATREELVDWLTSEAQFWSWAHRNNPTDLGLSDDKRNEFIGYVRRARDDFASGNAEEMNGSGERNLSLYAKSGLASSTARAQYINGLRAAEAGEMVGQAALAAYLGSAPDLNAIRQPREHRYPSLRGQIAIALFDAGVGRDAVAAVSHSIGEMSRVHSQTMDRQVATFEDTLAAYKAKFAEVDAQAQQTHNMRAEQHENGIASFVEETNASLKKINDTRQAYLEWMRIGAAVEYWRKKGKEHAENATWWLRALSGYATIGIGALALAFWQAFVRAQEVASSHAAAFDRIFLLETASLAALVTILFWIARFLSRLFLSERHMAIDADHRAVMAEAFLALSNDGKLEPTDRALVLQPLFRAGGDGIIKDDGGMDGLLAMIARTLEKPAAGGKG